MRSDGMQDIPDREDLDATLAAQRKKREFKEEDWFYKLRIIVLGITAFLAASVILIYLWHLVMPCGVRWLTEIDLGRIERMSATIIVGTIGSLATTYFFKNKR